MKFVWIPPGEFMMGSTHDDWKTGITNDPKHRVILTKGFYMGGTEVTVEQWGKIACEMHGFPGQKPKQPINFLFIEHAMEFAEQLTAKEKPKGRYRLPTEAEWEYACRAGTGKKVWFEEPKRHDYVWDIDSKPPLKENATSLEETLSMIGMPVGTKKPNPWGLYDMIGNQEEFVSDRIYWDNRNYYDHSPLKDPKGPTGEGTVHTLLRGIEDCTGRYYQDDRAIKPTWGFRLVFDPDP